MFRGMLVWSLTMMSAFTGACTAETAEIVPEAQTEDSLRVSEARIRRELEAATKGLFYTSESDYPWTYVSARLAQTDRHLTPALIAKKFNALADTKDSDGRELTEQQPELRDFGTFLADSPADPEADPEAAKALKDFAKVKRVLAKYLTDIKVVRFGSKRGNFADGPRVQIFVVGKNASGGLIGIRTISIET
jgi:Nuclease A inhibitor-like protein